MVQGFGNVGSHAAVLLAQLGVSLVAVGDHTGYLANPEGFNALPLEAVRRAERQHRRLPERQRHHARGVLRAQGRPLRPRRAREPDRPDEAEALQVRLVAEGANGPCSPEGEEVLRRRGIDILPDVLANAGGVTVSYYEWVQNKRSEQWTLEEVDDRLERAMLDAYERMEQFSRNKKCDYRLACYGVALERLARAYEDREIFP